MHGEASGTEFADAAQWQGQQDLLHPSASVVEAGPHADPMLLVTTSRWGHGNSHSERQCTGAHNYYRWSSGSSSRLRHNENNNFSYNIMIASL